MNDTNGVRIVGICGSVRPGNYTIKALRLVGEEIAARGHASFDLIDPSEMNLPLPGRTGDEKAVADLQARVKGATGIVLATPEYHGTFSAAIKLVIENLGFPSVLAGKPVALLGVAAGTIGAIKSLESLRGVASHVGGIVLPGPVSIARVNTVFDEDGTCTDAGIEKMVRGLGERLLDYIGDNICPRVALEAMVRNPA